MIISRRYVELELIYCICGLSFQVFRRSNVVNHFTNNALWVGFYKTKNISADIQVRWICITTLINSIIFMKKNVQA